MPTILVNPFDETPRPAMQAAKRLRSLEGATIWLLDISKPGGRVFLDRIEELLKTRHAVSRVVRESKPTFAKTAPLALLDLMTASRCDAVVEALAD